VPGRKPNDTEISAISFGKIGLHNRVHRAAEIIKKFGLRNLKNRIERIFMDAARTQEYGSKPRFRKGGVV
jgi:hypothetical protein